MENTSKTVDSSIFDSFEYMFSAKAIDDLKKYGSIKSTLTANSMSLFFSLRIRRGKNNEKDKIKAVKIIAEAINWLAEEDLLKGSLSTLSLVPLAPKGTSLGNGETLKQDGGECVFFFPHVDIGLAPWLHKRFAKKGISYEEGFVGEFVHKIKKVRKSND